MKITENNKKTLQILVILFIVGITGYNLLYPASIYKTFSLMAIEEKKANFDAMNQLITQNEGSIKSAREQLSSVKKDRDVKIKELNGLRNKIQVNELELHIPSILISFEQTAMQNNLELTIDYDKLQMSNDPMMMPPTDVPIDGGIMVEDTNPIGDGQSTPSDIGSILGSYSPPQLSNVSTTVVPVKIVGEYADVREFINYLDGLEYVDPGYIDMKSNGENVECIIIINIFHGGGF